MGRFLAVDGETRLGRSIKLFDGLAIVVGIMVGSGIFRTPDSSPPASGVRRSPSSPGPSAE